MMMDDRSPAEQQSQDAVASGHDDVVEGATLADSESARPPIYARTPWKQLLVIVILGVVWLGIGLVCSPRFFRF